MACLGPPARAACRRRRGSPGRRPPCPAGLVGLTVCSACCPARWCGCWRAAPSAISPAPSWREHVGWLTLAPGAAVARLCPGCRCRCCWRWHRRSAVVAPPAHPRRDARARRSGRTDSPRAAVAALRRPCHPMERCGVPAVTRRPGCGPRSAGWLHRGAPHVRPRPWRWWRPGLCWRCSPGRGGHERAARPGRAVPAHRAGAAGRPHRLGVLDWAESRLAGRAAPSWRAPWQDLARLRRKQTVLAESASPLSTPRRCSCFAAIAVAGDAGALLHPGHAVRGPRRPAGDRRTAGPGARHAGAGGTGRGHRGRRRSPRARP